MTDKQIIIDYVDVSGWTDEEVRHKFEQHSPKAIRQIAFELYKQLKRKEQEYKELRQYHNKCCEENAKKLEEWLEKFNQVSRDFYNGKYCDKENCNLLKAKEQENKEIIEKYRSVLEEIREDLETQIYCECSECGNDDYSECIKCMTKRYLQKISEVEK